MVHVDKGFLLKCSDSAIKQFIRHLEETNALGRKFILRDLDDTHLFVAMDVAKQLQQKLDEHMQRHAYSELSADERAPRVRRE